MIQAIHILFAAGFTVAVCLAAGWLLLRRLGTGFRGGEAAVLAFPLGAACVSLAVFLLCLVHQARHGVFLWAGVAVIGGACFSLPSASARSAKEKLSASWKLLLFLSSAAFFLVYFFNSLAPEVSPDGAGYHLENVARYWRQHGFAWDHRTLYSALSQGMEMLFLVAFTFGRHSAAALVHMAFQAVLPLLMVFYGRRFGIPRVGICGALLVYASPVVGIAGISAYNDLAVATLLFTGFYLLQVWDEKRTDNLLILVGLLYGFAFGVKYTALFGLVFATGLVGLRAKRPGPIVKVLLAALLMAAPWALRNWFWLGNPAAPFLNAWFPNPYFHPGPERDYLAGLAHYPAGTHFWNIPIQLTITGGLVPGMVGPIFLLAPVALLSLRQSQGRRLVAAAALFAIPAYLNTEPRFLIPVLPFVALAMGLAVSEWRGALAALAILQLVLCWPTVLSKYCAPYSWRLQSIPIRAALRKQPETEFIRTRIPEYSLKEPIEAFVPPNGKVFSFDGRPSAYWDRDIVVGYESALANWAQDTLLNAVEHTPSIRQRFRFASASARGVRVVQMASASRNWTVSEMRVLAGGGELPRVPAWRLSAWPNGWDVQLAFDNNYATRWSTWQPMPSGAFVAIDFGRIEKIDEVVIECVPARDARLHVEILDARGQWVALPGDPEMLDFTPPAGLRRAAALALKARGIGYLLINDSNSIAGDMRKYVHFWGIAPLAEAAGVHLYRIE
jgi:hypothetical protein